MTTTTPTSRKTYEELKRERDEREARDKAYLAEMGIEWPRCGFWVDRGWRALVDETLKKMIAAGWDRSLSQVKQKFCELRIYVGTVPRDPAITAIIDEATKRSHEICEGCGLEREAKGIQMGRAYCNACKAKPIDFF